MIPASYMFKDIYHQHWEQPDAPASAEQNHAPKGGLLTPLAHLLRAITTRRKSATGYQISSPAYD
ncbi:hypothetical protein [Devosia sp. 2618]|uniref:hypothetical protein n=1 Tax=Devosia sp. 2618 TaxID=3156454 RepID=UPI0033924C9C